MEENPSRVSRKDGTTEGSSTGMTRRSRYPVEDAGDVIECSGEFCRSCTASFLVDCVAVCCCPCAVVNLLAFVFVKVPWMIGRRCLGLGKKKSRALEREERKKGKGKDCVIVERDGNSRKDRLEKGTLEVSSGFVEEEGKRFEADRVWLELFQLGHLGFGGVPFSGIQGKGN